MTTGAEDPSSDRRASGLAAVCSQLADITDILEEKGQGGMVTRLLESVRSGADPLDTLEEIHTALITAGDELGLFGTILGGIDGAGLHVRSLQQLVFLCPAADRTRACLRVWLPEQGATVPPTCALHGHTLRWESLGS